LKNIGSEIDCRSKPVKHKVVELMLMKLLQSINGISVWLPVSFSKYPLVFSSNEQQINPINPQGHASPL